MGYIRATDADEAVGDGFVEQPKPPSTSNHFGELEYTPYPPPPHPHPGGLLDNSRFYLLSISDWLRSLFCYLALRQSRE